MQNKWNWFERTFDFEFPAEKMPDIIERLQGSPLRFGTIIADLTEQQLVRREAENTWSIKENVGHLTDLEPLWYGRIEDILSGKETMRDADLSNALTFSANHNDCETVDLIKKFESARIGLLRVIGDLEFTSWSAAAMHPRLNQPMRIVDLCNFIAEHDDYHLAQIRYLLRHFRGQGG